MALEQIRDLLGWCALINLGLLLISFLFFWLAHGWVYRVHTRWCRLSVETFDAIWYALMGFFKVCVLLFNVVPYVALWIVG